MRVEYRFGPNLVYTGIAQVNPASGRGKDVGSGKTVRVIKDPYAPHQYVTREPGPKALCNIGGCAFTPHGGGRHTWQWVEKLVKEET